ncbi:glucosamine-6-phosphate deaminase [Bacillus fonticola]|uniref:glucosamine-6-phosphate deaminase n=1 Tax=Bacillus fonticola TaxID=2728853 RepID=UPI001472C219|nr:glucosamine-6-phosphate deaminase [Bacillus fonticola]
MNIEVCKQAEDVGIKAAELVVQERKQTSSFVLGCATGGTPIPFYRELVSAHYAGRISFTDVQTLNLDEYVGLSQNDPQSYYAYMQEHLFQYVNLPSTHTHLPNGTANSLPEECRRYESLFTSYPVDVQILGLGHNGHIGFNEPGSSLNSTTRIVKLAEETRQANARYFSSAEEVPSRAITAGIRTIMRAKHIVLLVSGENKKAAMTQLLNTRQATEQFPASVLWTHPQVTIFVDEAACPEAVSTI